MAPPKARLRRDPWPQEREGYQQPTPVAYAPVHCESSSSGGSTLVRRAEQLGSLIAGGGIIWITYTITHHSAEILHIAIFPRGPLETLGAGVLIWLVAKWCRAVHPH